MSTADVVWAGYFAGIGVWIVAMRAWLAASGRNGWEVETLMSAIFWPGFLLAVAGKAMGQAVYRRRERVEAARKERQRILDTPVERLVER
jgi:hypothetical protein